MRDVAAIILAAGRSSRFGTEPGETKLAANLDGKPLIVHVAAAALASRAAPVGVVTGHAAEKVLCVLAGLDLFAVHNLAYADGLSSSLKAGIAALPAQIEGVIVLLADMPFVTSPLIDQLITCFEAAPAAPDAVVPIHKGRRGNPVLIGRRLFPEIATLDGDRGAAGLLKQPGRRIFECPIADAGVEIDVDTSETLKALQRGALL